MSDWTDGKPLVATEEHLNLRWGGAPRGRRFRCYLCGHFFKVGDTWRWQMVQGYMNFMVCVERLDGLPACDGPDVVERWKAFNDELAALHERAWWDYVPKGHRCSDYL